MIDVQTRRIASVEIASKFRVSVHEVGATPFFHANMYSHLQNIKQVTIPGKSPSDHIRYGFEVKINCFGTQIIDENSTSRKRRADVMPKESKDDFLCVLGDAENKSFPIYMKGKL